MANSGPPQPTEDVYIPEMDVEDLEDYAPGGYHPTMIGDSFQDGQYTVVHKLGYGGFSTIWLARDHSLGRYVALKILAADASSRSNESTILRLLQHGSATHPGKQFIPPLLDEFSFEGPNGNHICLVEEPAWCNVSMSKEDYVDFMFPVDTARSIAAQLIMGVSYLHACGVCHGDLHMRNFLLRAGTLDFASADQIYQRHGRPTEAPVRRIDGKAPEPHAPAHVIYTMNLNMPADEVLDPKILISDYGTSFEMATKADPKLHTPALYLPPEDFFDEPITLAADIWTLGVNLYEVLGERPLFETFACDRDDIIAEMVSTLGRLPQRWWDGWANRMEFFQADGSWISDFKRISTPVFRPLRQRIWDMGRGETGETCQWDVEGGELRALEDLLRGTMQFEPAERFTAEQLMASEYMEKWAMPAWERQLGRLKK